MRVLAVYFRFVLFTFNKRVSSGDSDSNNKLTENMN